MTTTPNAGADNRTRRYSPAARRSRMIGTAALGLTALAAAGALAGGATPGRAAAAVLTNCAANTVSCGYPGATNTGVPAGTTLKTVGTQLTSGPGWTYNATQNTVTVTVNGTVISGLYIPGTLQIEANNVTVDDDQIVTNGNFGVALVRTANATIENTTISGQDSAANRLGYGVDDVYGGSTGTVVENDNIYYFKTAIQLGAGLIQGNYIHDPGFVTGDHTNGIYAGGSTTQLTIVDNTILNNLNQTDDINLDAASSGSLVSNKTIENNFLAGGGYSIYGGTGPGNPTSNILIEGNRFGQQYYTTGGEFGPVAYYSATATGDVWSGNIWDTTAQSVSS